MGELDPADPTMMDPPDDPNDPVDPVDPTGTPVQAVLGGPVILLSGFEGLTVTGHGQLVKGANGTGDRVELAVSGLTGMLQYTAHVHALPCEFSGGGHYKLDPAIAEVQETNEVWLRFTTDAAGVGLASVTTPTPLRGDAMSLVVHDPVTSNKMACMDFKPKASEPVAAVGTVAPFAAAELIDQTIGGTATLVRGMSETVVSINITGLDAATSYGAHVHNQPCAVTTGGGHYKLDPLIVEALETNELWPVIGNQPDGIADSTKSVALHVARSDAQSFVVHRLIEGATTPPPKVACADLVPERHFNFPTSGIAELTPDGVSRGMDGLFGTATMIRELTGLTRVQLAISGAPADTTFKVHVHNLSCAEGGGSHYKIDTTVTDPVESNEMWLTVETDGAGSGQYSHAWGTIARPDAASLVLHDASDNAKIACIDLN